MRHHVGFVLAMAGALLVAPVLPELPDLRGTPTTTSPADTIDYPFSVPWLCEAGFTPRSTLSCDAGPALRT